MAKGKDSQKLIANNKKAYHDFFIDETYECGIALHGTEVKSMRMGKCSIKEAFIRIEDGEVFVYGMHVSPYEKGNIFNKDPLRVKKLLMHKYEINKLLGKIKEKGYTLVPLQVYFKVLIPILKPTIISTAILELMWVWNDYLLPTLVLDIKKYKTIPMAVQYFRGSFGHVQMGPMMASIMIDIIPIIIVYLVCQKYIIEGVVAGAVKG